MVENINKKNIIRYFSGKSIKKSCLSVEELKEIYHSLQNIMEDHNAIIITARILKMMLDQGLFIYKLTIQDNLIKIYITKVHKNSVYLKVFKSIILNRIRQYFKDYYDSDLHIYQYEFMFVNPIIGGIKNFFLKKLALLKYFFYICTYLFR